MNEKRKKSDRIERIKSADAKNPYSKKTKQLFLTTSFAMFRHSESLSMIPPLIPLVQESPCARCRPVEALEIISSAALLPYAELRLVARWCSARATSRHIGRAVRCGWWGDWLRLALVTEGALRRGPGEFVDPTEPGLVLGGIVVCLMDCRLG